MSDTRTAAEHDKEVFDGQWELDPTGNTLLCSGIRKVKADPESNPATRSRMMNGILAFCRAARRLVIEKDWPTPRMFYTIDLNEIKDKIIVPVITVEVKREDGKVARIALSLTVSGDGNKISGRVTCQKKSSDPFKELTATFVDWEQVGK